MMGAAAPLSRPGRRLALFLLLLAICSWHLETARDDNTVSRALAVHALVEEGRLDITPHHAVTGDKARTGDRYYSDKAPLPAWTVAALWKAARAAGLAQPAPDPVDPRVLRLGGFLFGSVPMALIVLLAIGELKRQRPQTPLLLAAAPLLGSFLFVYSGTFYNHLPAALFGLLAALALRDGRPARAGFFAGLGVACDAALLFAAAAWAAQCVPRRRALGAMLLGLLPGALVTMANNWAVTGSPLSFPSAHAVNYGVMREGYGFLTWQPDAFLGLTVSPYRGLLVYAPALGGAVLLAFAEWRRLAQRRMLLDPFIAPALLTVAAFFTHATWWGGWAYGPRYLTIVPVLLLVRALPGIAARPWLARTTIALGLIGLVNAVAAKLTAGHGLPTGELHPLRGMVWRLVREGAFHGAGWPLEVGFSPAMGAFLFAASLAAAYFGARRLLNESP